MIGVEEQMFMCMNEFKVEVSDNFCLAGSKIE